MARNHSDTLFATIKELVERGKYQSPESVLEIADFNQLALERGASPAEIIGRGHRKVGDGGNGDGLPKHSRLMASVAEASPVGGSTRRAAQPVAQARQDGATLTEAEYGDAFRRLAHVPRPGSRRSMRRETHTRIGTSVK